MDINQIRNKKINIPFINSTLLLKILVSMLITWAFISLSGVERVSSLVNNRNDYKNNPIASEDIKEEEEYPSVFGSKIDPIYEIPIKMYAKKQGTEEKFLEAEVVEVGVKEGGQLEAPKEWNNAGWYNRSAKVGEPGNIIINGHYDNNYGQAAAFYDLKTLEINDRVYVVDSFGRYFAYQVTETFYVGISDKDRIDKLMESDGETLTLVTCGGVWVPSQGTYSNRLVVKAKKAD